MPCRTVSTRATCPLFPGCAVPVAQTSGAAFRLAFATTAQRPHVVTGQYAALTHARCPPRAAVIRGTGTAAGVALRASSHLCGKRVLHRWVTIVRGAGSAEFAWHSAAHACAHACAHVSSNKRMLAGVAERDNRKRVCPALPSSPQHTHTHTGRPSSKRSSTTGRTTGTASMASDLVTEVERRSGTSVGQPAAAPAAARAKRQRRCRRWKALPTWPSSSKC